MRGAAERRDRGDPPFTYSQVQEATMRVERRFGVIAAIAVVAGLGCSESKKPGAAPPAQQGPWTITVSPGAGGTITPPGPVSVAHGGSATFAVAASAGFVVSDVIVDGVPQGAVATYTFTNVTAAHTIVASFTALPTSAIVRLQTQGTLPTGTLIGGVLVTLTYATDKGLSITAGNVGASGAGAGSLLVANASVAGQVIVGLVNASGFGTGELATATFQVAPPNVPVAADFALAPGTTVIDLDGAPIPGVTVAIAPPDVI
jgi:hypothetical protein